MVRGRLTFDGRPLSEITRTTPHFWFRNEEKNIVEEPIVEYDAGRFTIRDLPIGRMGMSTNVDLNSENPVSYPGDLRSWTPFEVKETDNVDVEVNMQEVIHLVEPQDNGAVMDHWGVACKDMMLLPSPVRFVWDSMGPDVSYRIRITSMECLDTYRFRGTVVETKVASNAYTADLPPSKEDECYLFHLYAAKNGRTIGTLMTHGKHGMGWDYRFRVLEEG